MKDRESFHSTYSSSTPSRIGSTTQESSSTSVSTIMMKRSSTTARTVPTRTVPSPTSSVLSRSKITNDEHYYYSNDENENTDVYPPDDQMNAAVSSVYSRYTSTHYSVPTTRYCHEDNDEVCCIDIGNKLSNKTHTKQHSITYDDEYDNNDEVNHETNVDMKSDSHRRHSYESSISNSNDSSGSSCSTESAVLGSLPGRTVVSNHTKRNTTTSNNGTIALFGAFGRTGNHFLRLALDAGYQVRALLVPSATVTTAGSLMGSRKSKIVTAAALQEEFSDQETTQLTWISSKRLDDPKNIRQTIENVDYVVCMLNDTIESITTSADDVGGSLIQNVLSKNHSKTNKKPGNRNNNKFSNKRIHVGPLTKFVQILYPLMKDVPTIQVFLYEATSFAIGVDGIRPVMSQLLQTVTCLGNTSKRYSYYDQNHVIEYISHEHHYHFGENEPGLKNITDSMATLTASSSSSSAMIRQEQESAHDENDIYHDDAVDHMHKKSDDCTTTRDKSMSLMKPHFAYIVTRPTILINDQPSVKKLNSSKSQPGPFPITHIDLAEFSLNALVTKKLYNTCPYVVGDT